LKEERKRNEKGAIIIQQRVSIYMFTRRFVLDENDFI